MAGSSLSSSSVSRAASRPADRLLTPSALNVQTAPPYIFAGIMYFLIPWYSDVGPSNSFMLLRWNLG